MHGDGFFHHRCRQGDEYGGRVDDDGKSWAGVPLTRHLFRSKADVLSGFKTCTSDACPALMSFVIMGLEFGQSDTTGSASRFLSWSSTLDTNFGNKRGTRCSIVYEVS